MAEWGRVLSISASASLWNASPSLSSALQSALIGRTSPKLLAGFAAGRGVAELAGSLFNFLVEGVVAKVGAERAKPDKAAAVTRLSAISAVALGVVAWLVLAGFQGSILSLFAAAEPVRVHAKSYLNARLPSISAQLLANALSGALAGLGRGHEATFVSLSRAILDALFVPFALYVTSGSSLLAVGLAHALSIHLQALIGGLILAAKRPPGFPLRGSPASLRRCLTFAADSASMVIRAALLQGTFFLCLVSASRLGTPSLAAHAVIRDLWVLQSTIVDGLATAGTALGSSLASSKMKQSLRNLSVKLLLLGVAFGVAFLGIYGGLGRWIAPLFTTDESVLASLRDAWPILSVSQPVNSLVFVADGLLYAIQAFSFAREAMEVGVGLIFLPFLAWAVLGPHPSLRRVWISKLALNSWRLAALSARIVWYMFAPSQMQGDDSPIWSDDDRADGLGYDSDVSGDRISHDEEDRLLAASDSF